jgi:pyridoxine 5-phosphate synthase
MKAIPMNRLRLGFNVDHVATLRNARGEAYPDPVDAARIAVAAGADGITAHLREDRRHMRDADMHRLRAEIAAPLNFEMGATEEMVAIALSVRPHACCLVPERRAEVTTEGGLDVAGNAGPLRATVARLAEAGIRVSLFIDPDIRQLDAALAVGAPVVELHTGPYAHATEPAAHRTELARLETAAAHAERIGLECHAGHGLTFANVGAVAAIPTLAELNIGHFLVSHAVFDGLPATIARMRALMDEARGAT